MPLFPNARRLPALAGWLLAATVLAAGAAEAEPLHLRIVHFNDIDRMADDDGRGGLPKLATVIAQAREGAEHVLITHGGDTISPSLLSGIDRGAHFIELLNQVGIDVMTLGNHEYDFGPDVMVERVAEAEFPVLSANSVAPGGGLPEGVLANTTFTFDDWTIGVFGLTTPTTAERSSPAPVTFRDVNEVAAEQAAELEAQGADFVIALAHTTMSEDDRLIAQAAMPLILGGDDHDLRIKWFGATAFVESNSQADLVTVIDLTLDRDADGKVVWHASYDVVNTLDVEPDATITAAVAVYEALLDEELGVEIGTTATALDSRRQSLRTAENAFGSLVADAMRAAVGADIAITNGGGIRADREYPAGTVLTRRDIQEELPFGNRTVLMELTGADVVAALENGFSGLEDVAGRFPHVSGMTVEYAPGWPAGQRVVAVTVGDAPLDPAATYLVATNDYMARGGDGYTAFQSGRIIIDPTSGEFMASQVMDYIAAAGEIAPTVEGRLVAVTP
ncbi:MAG: 5'-nucleotidase C-terminal domain-containing protein [Rhodospirillaceae bacterium]|nr:5'-nucleotidase C-terminal domain-containing protein [Rhodospirillaceae bacterium]